MSGNKMKNVQMLIVFLVALGLFWYFYGGGLEKQTAKEIKRIEKQVAQDAIKQYRIAKRHGSAIDAYVQAGIVAAAFLQAKDEANYKKWKKIEKKDMDYVLVIDGEQK